MKMLSLSFWYHLLQRFLADGCLYRASALTLTTLIALVPLTTVLLGLLSVFPFMKNVGSDIQSFIFANFVPQTGQIIQSYLQLFVKQTQQLSYIGITALGITVLFLIISMEQTFNHIWRTRKTYYRGYLQEIMHWTALLLLPFVMGGTMAFVLLIYSMPIVTEALRTFHAQSLLICLLPLFLSGIGFTFFYLFLPRPSVPLRYALLSGFLCALLLALMKWGFVLYLGYFPIYQKIYGALYVIPLFLIWIDLSWIVVLFGAELCYGLGATKA
ncbi:MAG: YihY family inner membrane protein [Gammaproteobacteria bacterium]